MGNMKDIADNVRGNLIPELSALRRVPIRYRYILPLTVVKRFQCIVIGSAQGVLTVAITERQNTTVIELLKRYTGQTIFPVLVEPNRMSLLIRRIERYQQCRRFFYIGTRNASVTACYMYTVRRLEVDSMVMLLSSPRTKR